MQQRHVSALIEIAMVAPHTAQAMTDAQRLLAIDSYNDTFYVSDGRIGYFGVDTTRARPDRDRFWMTCEQIEMIEDAYDRTQLPVYRTMVRELINGLNVVVAGTKDWASWNKFNDDIMWGVIALVRAYRITGDRTYLNQAQLQFDKVWVRAWDTKLGGGLWWTTDRGSKNACVNGPGAIAAIYMATTISSGRYLKLAKQAYIWLRNRLFDPTTGRIYDHMDSKGTLIDWPFTYNQGTFIGAATLLFKATGDASYLADARKAAYFAKDQLTGQHLPGILNDEYGETGGMSDGVGFKGVFARWCGHYARTYGDATLRAWLTANADSAWANRNAANVSWSQWWRTTPDSVTSWECSSALAMICDAP